MSCIQVDTNIIQSTRITADTSVVCPVDEGGAWYRFDIHKTDNWRMIK